MDPLVTFFSKLKDASSSDAISCSIYHSMQMMMDCEFKQEEEKSKEAIEKSTKTVVIFNFEKNPWNIHLQSYAPETFPWDTFGILFPVLLPHLLLYHSIRFIILTLAYRNILLY